MVDTPASSAGKTLLQQCASGSDHYFNVSSGSGMNSAFQAIASQIAKLHLSK